MHMFCVYIKCLSKQVSELRTWERYIQAFPKQQYQFWTNNKMKWSFIHPTKNNKKTQLLSRVAEPPPPSEVCFWGGGFLTAGRMSLQNCKKLQIIWSPISAPSPSNIIFCTTLINFNIMSQVQNYTFHIWVDGQSWIPCKISRPNHIW